MDANPATQRSTLPLPEPIDVASNVFLWAFRPGALPAVAFRTLPPKLVNAPEQTDEQREHFKKIHGKYAYYAWIEHILEPHGVKPKWLKKTIALANLKEAKQYKDIGRLNASDSVLAAVYFLPNGGGQKKAEINQFASFFIEYDNLTLEEQYAFLMSLPIPPDIIVKTKNSLHAYWLAVEGTTAEQWDAVQRTFIVFADSDRSIKDRPRLMRMPGHDHLVIDCETGKIIRTRVTVLKFDTSTRRTAADMLAMLAGLGQPEVSRPDFEKWAKEKNGTDERLQTAKRERAATVGRPEKISEEAAADIQTLYEAILDKLDLVGPSDGSERAVCPSCSDPSPSMIIGIGEKGIVMMCHAGCTFAELCEAVGVEQKQMFYKRAQGQPKADREAAQKETETKKLEKLREQISPDTREKISLSGLGVQGEVDKSLWSGDLSEYAGDRDEGVKALLRELANVCGPDPVKIDELFRQSEMFRYIAKDWENEIEGDPFGRSLIAKAIDDVRIDEIENDEKAVKTGAAIPDADDLDAARKVVAALATAKGDTAKLFDPVVIGALALLERSDAGAYVTAKGYYKGSVPELKAAIRSHRQRARLQLIEGGNQPKADAQDYTVGDVFGDAPFPQCIIPSPYTLTTEGVQKTVMVKTEDGGMRPDLVVVAPFPIILSGVVNNLSDSERFDGRRVSWYRRNQWHSLIVSAGELFDKSRIMGLIDKGLTVGSANAWEVAAFLYALDHANQHILPHARTVNQTGYVQGDPDKGFLGGLHWYVDKSGEIHSLSDIDAGQWNSEIVYFKGEPGDRKFVSGYKPTGSFEKFKEMTKLFAPFPIPRKHFYYNHVGPLLDIFGCDNLADSIANTTHTGKTTCQVIGAAIWGDPRKGEPSTTLHNCLSTLNAMEGISALIGYMPVIFNDTKPLFDDPKQTQALVHSFYVHEQGSGKNRKNRNGGMAETSHWRGTRSLSGENSILDAAKAGGLVHRLMEDVGDPFPPDSADLVEKINDCCKENFGHGGPVFIQFIYKNRANWGKWRERYSAARREYVKKAADPATASGLAQMAAAIRIAGELAHEAYGLDWKFQDPFDELWMSASARTADPLGAEKALRHIVAWANANMQKFWCRHKTDNDGFARPVSEWYGKWERLKGNVDNWNYIAFTKGPLENELKRLGYIPDEIIGQWAARDWLVLSEGEKKTKKRQHCMRAVEGAVDFLYAIKRDVIDRVCGKIEEEKAQPVPMKKLTPMEEAARGNIAPIQTPGISPGTSPAEPEWMATMFESQSTDQSQYRGKYADLVDD